MAPAIAGELDLSEETRPGGPAVEITQATGKGCGTTQTIESILSSAAYEMIYTDLQGEAGFVDLYVGHDGVAFAAAAVFDMDARTEPVPEIPVSLDGIPIQVVGERFTTLLDAPEPETRDPPLIPALCPSEIRPGARMTGPAGCTFSFVFSDQNNRLYISTAGHCTTNVGDRVSAADVGTFGTTVFTTGSGGLGNDFALVQVDSDKEDLVNPAMCHWGGPTGLANAGTFQADHYGWGMGYGIAAFTRPRSGYLTFTGTESWAFTGTAIFGDSGSGVINSDGPALGTLTHVGVGFIGNTFGTRTSHGVDLAEQETGLQLSLETAPLA